MVQVLPALVYDETRKEEIDVETDHDLTNPYDGWSYGLRWLSERKAGELVHKSELVGKPQTGYMSGDTMGDIGLDPSEMVRKANRNTGGDWRTH